MREIAPGRWIRSAHRRLGDARFLLEDGRVQTAMPQVYFAVFYACQALLVEAGYRFSTHKSVIGNIGRIERYRSVLDTRLPSVLQDERNLSDYELVEHPSEHVGEQLRRADQFIGVAGELLD